MIDVTSQVANCSDYQRSWGSESLSRADIYRGKLKKFFRSIDKQDKVTIWVVDGEEIIDRSKGGYSEAERIMEYYEKTYKMNFSYNPEERLITMILLGEAKRKERPQRDRGYEYN